jgi:hypothetical protein
MILLCVKGTMEIQMTMMRTTLKAVMQLAVETAPCAMKVPVIMILLTAMGIMKERLYMMKWTTIQVLLTLLKLHHYCLVFCRPTKINADVTCKSGRHISTASAAAPTGISTIIVDAVKRAAPASDEEVILQSQGPKNQQQHPEHGFQHQLSAYQAVPLNTLVKNVPTQLLSHEYQQSTHLGVHSKVVGEVAVEALPCLAPFSIALLVLNTGQGRPWQFPVSLMPRYIAPAPVDQAP